MPNRKLKLIVIFLGALAVGSLGAFFISGNTSLQTNGLAEQIGGSIIKALPEKGQGLDSINKYFYYLKNKTTSSRAPVVSAESYTVGDLNTGEVILAKNENSAFPIASVSKLMTALLATSLNAKDETAIVSRQALATYGENGDFHLGEKIKVSDIIYPLLLESSNDAAEILAEHFGRDNFISKMNEMAKNLNMSSTHYADPSGLSADNKSTVSDLFRLVGYLSQNNKNILDITTKRSYSNKKHTWYNTSQFLREKGFLGGKSGYIDAAMQTDAVTFSLPLAKFGSRPIAITLLRSKGQI
jgi:D-alanyl-D-alanine endopeptidase (penicillin-binding protein 7)